MSNQPKLFYGNNLGVLLDALAAEVGRSGGGFSDLFEPVHIIVPDASTGALVQTGLAARLGLAAHIRFHRGAEAFLQWVLGQAAQTLRVKGVLLRDRDAWAMSLALVEALEDPAWIQQPSLRLVRMYLEGLDEAPEDRLSRALQLALETARFMDAYRFECPQLLEHWSNGDWSALSGSAQTEAWQRALWLAIQRPETGLLDQWARRCEGLRWVDITRLAVDCPEALAKLPGRVLMFGIQWLPRALRSTFQQLAAHTQLCVYHLNPCMEFVEDLPDTLTPGQRDMLAFDFPSRYAPTDSPDGLERTARVDDALPLRLWGRVAREGLRLWLKASARANSRFVEPDGPQTLLRQLQRDITRREAERRPGHNTLEREADGSLCVLACGSIQREVEVVANEIWTMLMANPPEGSQPLRLTDIAVWVNQPQRDLYLTRLQSVFHDAYQLPFTLLDLPPGAVSRYLEALRLLLALPLGDFSREDMLRLMTHPCSLEAGSGTVDVVQWATWCEQLGILRGADSAAYANSYVEQDLFNWDQGIRRLFLGAWMADCDQPVTLGDRPYIPLHVPETHIQEAARWGLLVRSLIADARFARDARLSLRQWAKLIVGLTGYLCTQTDEDERLRSACLHCIEALGDADIDGREVSYTVAQALLNQRLDQITMTRGQHLIDGVTVGSLLPPRIGSWKVVFVLGMGEGRFPNPEPPSSLDLRQSLRRTGAGDASGRELEQALLLDLLSAARERFVISYVSRDEQTGEGLSPSYVVQNLLGMLERGYLQDGHLSKVHVQTPLKRYDQSGAGPLHIPEAQREVQAVALREDLRAHAPHILERLHDHPQRLRQVMDFERWRILCDQLGLMRLPEAPERFEQTDQLTLPVSALRRFLRSPLQAAARFLLNLADDTLDNPLARQHEPFEVEPRQAVQLLQQVFVLGISGGEDRQRLTEVYDQAIERLQLQGQHPVGVFAAAQRARHLKMLGVWRRELLGATSERDLPLRKALLGAGKRGEDTQALLPPLVLEVSPAPGRAPLTVSITGHTGLLTTDRRASVKLMSQRSAVKDRDWLDPFLDHALLAATHQHAPDAPHRAVAVCYSTGGRASGALHEQRQFPALSAERAKAYLGGVVECFLQRTHDYLLPVEAVLNARTRGSTPEAITAEVYALLRQRQFSNHADLFGPVRHIDRYRAPRADVDTLARVRLGLFLEQLRASESAKG